jgi:hypothetical protein
MKRIHKRQLEEGTLSLPGIEPHFLSRTVRSQSLSRLSYSCSVMSHFNIRIMEHRPVAKRRLSKQQRLLGNALNIHARRNRTREERT